MKAVRDGMQNITFDHYNWFSFFIIGLLPLERFQVAEVINKGRVWYKVYTSVWFFINISQ